MSFESFIGHLGKISAEVDDLSLLKQAASLAQSQAKLNTPVFEGALRNSIGVQYGHENESMVARIYTDMEYAPYVELGTGPIGAENHEGISPEVNPMYTLEPWWIHESQLDPGVAEMYHWPYIETPQGKFYRCSGQPAKPFMYPAVKDNEKIIIEMLTKKMNDIIGGGK